MNTPCNVIVFFDKNCIDGTASVSIFRDVLKKNPLANPTYVPIDYTDPLNRNAFIFGHLRDGDEVFFLDTAPKDDTLQYFIDPPEGFAKVKRVTVFDHHRTEVERLNAFLKKHRSTPFCRSGPEFKFVLDANIPAAAMLVWDHYHVDSYEIPPLLEWIARMDVDVDLKTEREKAIAAFIDCNELDTPEKCFMAYERLNKEIAHEGAVAKRGKVILKEQTKTIKNNIETAFLYAKIEVASGQIEWVPIVNANPRNHGRVLNEVLLEKAREGTCGIAGSWFVDHQDKVHLSLRSISKPTAADAAKYIGTTIGVGGGGHGPAAVVTFGSLLAFAQSVPRYTEGQMMEERGLIQVCAGEAPLVLLKMGQSTALIRNEFH